MLWVRWVGLATVRRSSSQHASGYSANETYKQIELNGTREFVGRGRTEAGAQTMFGRADNVGLRQGWVRTL